MAKQTELKERGTNVTLYPVTTVAQVLGTDGNPITDKVLPTKGAEGTILTVKNGAVTWDAPTSGEITSADVKMQGTTKTLNQILTPDSLSITEGAINISSSDGNLNFNSVGLVNNSHHEIYSDKNLDITVPASVKFQCNDIGSDGWGILSGNGDAYFGNIQAAEIITPVLVGNSSGLTIGQPSSTWNIASNGDAKFKDVIADNYKILSKGGIALNGDDFTIELNQYGTHSKMSKNKPELYCSDALCITSNNRLVFEVKGTESSTSNIIKFNNQGASFDKSLAVHIYEDNYLTIDAQDEEFCRISTSANSPLFIGSETNTNVITFNQSISLWGEDIYYRSSNTTKSIKAADLDLINYIKGIGSGIALVPESEGSSKLTNTKITFNHYLDLIILNGNYSLMLESGFVSKLPAIGKHVVFQNDSIETRIITLPNNASIKSDKETLTVTAKGYAVIDLIKGSTGTILIKSSVL